MRPVNGLSEFALKNQFVGHSFYAIGTEEEKLIVFMSENSLVEADIKMFLKEKMQIHPTVIAIKILKDTPLTSNGKVNYSILASYV